MYTGDSYNSITVMESTPESVSKFNFNQVGAVGCVYGHNNYLVVGGSHVAGLSQLIVLTYSILYSQ